MVKYAQSERENTESKIEVQIRRFPPVTKDKFLSESGQQADIFE
jgi:hypothetical protein